MLILGAYHVEVVSALSSNCVHRRQSAIATWIFKRSLRCLRLTQRTFVAWEFARRACGIEVDLTDTAHIILWDVPPPCCDSVPLFDCDLHGGDSGLLRAEVCRSVVYVPSMRCAVVVYASQSCSGVVLGSMHALLAKGVDVQHAGWLRCDRKRCGARRYRKQH